MTYIGSLSRPQRPHAPVVPRERVAAKPPPPPPTRQEKVHAALIYMAKMHEVDVEDLVSATRSPAILRVRARILIELRDKFGLSTASLAKLFGDCDPSTIRLCIRKYGREV